MRLRYLIKFNKTGSLKFIGHLDLLRLLHRCVRLACIDIDYSKGFNPHPLVTIAQPLAVGMEGYNELCVFELKTEAPADMMININNACPQGLSITDTRPMPETEKSPASLIRAAEYEIICDIENMNVVLPCGSVKNIRPDTVVKQLYDEAGELYLPHKVIIKRKELFKHDEDGRLICVF